MEEHNEIWENRLIENSLGHKGMGEGGLDCLIQISSGHEGG